MIAIRLNLTQRHLYYEGHVSVTSYMSLGGLWFITLFIKLDKTDAISKTHCNYKNVIHFGASFVLLDMLHFN